MKVVTPKYNIGDKVYLMRDTVNKGGFSKPMLMTIHAIRININSRTQTVYYEFEYTPEYTFWSGSGRYYREDWVRKNI